MNKEPIFKTITIDVDDTIEDLLGAWVNYLNRKHNLSVKKKDITDWDMAKFFPSLTKEQIFQPLKYETFWDFVKPKKDASKYIKKLIDDGYNVYLCTSTDYQNIKTKFEKIIKKYFPYINWNQVIICQKKQMIMTDILIDDGVHNLENGHYIKILMSAPHNEKYDAEKNHMYRVNNWEEIYNLIKSFNDILYESIEGGNENV